MAKLRAASDEEERLRRELYEAGDRLLSRVFVVWKGKPPLTIPILRRIVQTVEPSEYNASPTLALQRVIERAIQEYLEDTPILNRPKLTWRDLAWRLYEPTSLTPYNERVQEARAYCGLPRDKKDPERFKDTTAHMRLLLARKLLEMERREQEPPRPTASPGYVSRPNLEAKLREATRKPGVVLLYGDAGMGKTTLVTELVRDTAPTKRVVVHSDNDSLLCLELRKELSRIGRDVADLSDTAVKQYLRTLLKEGNAPRYVLIENVADEQIISDLIPSECRASVFVLARRRLRHPLVAHAIRVGPMEEAEAAQLAQNIASTLGEDAIGLARWLGGHPLGIEAACGLLADNTLTLDELAEVLRHDRATVASVRASEAETNLLVMYEETLRRFDQSRTYAPAIAVLEAVSCVASGGIPRSLLVAYLAAKARATPSLTYELFCSSALELLAERCLLTTNDRYVSIHPLSQAIWRKVFEERFPDIAKTLDGIMRQLALKDVVESRPTHNAGSHEDLDQYLPATEESGQLYMQQLWDSHYFALVDAVKDRLPLEELECDATRGGYGSRASRLLKYTLFAGLPHGGAKWEQQLQAELGYFGVTRDEAERLLYYPLLRAQEGRD